MRYFGAGLFILVSTIVLHGVLFPMFDYLPTTAVSILCGIPIGVIAALLFQED